MTSGTLEPWACPAEHDDTLFVSPGIQAVETDAGTTGQGTVAAGWGTPFPPTYQNALLAPQQSAVSPMQSPTAAAALSRLCWMSGLVGLWLHHATTEQGSKAMRKQQGRTSA